MRTLNQHLSFLTQCLAEDLGTAGDITSQATIPATLTVRAHLRLKQDAVVCGLSVVRTIFALVDRRTKITFRVTEGSVQKRGTILAEIKGSARSILAAERVALNFLQRMSGIATQTRQYVDAVRGTRAKILDTRKTTPGLRAFEKYATRTGGAINHRWGLYDAILIKDNHIAAAGGVANAVARCRAKGHRRIHVEVESLAQARAAVAAGATSLLLDNMPPAILRRVVAWARVHAPSLSLEASGGVRLATVARVAASGVDAISVGALTHSVPAVDISLDVTL